MLKIDKWSKPEVIVLLRNHPEETLQQEKCKHPFTVEGFNNQWNAACAENAGPAEQCFNSADQS
jgi:hypothetical protein